MGNRVNRIRTYISDSQMAAAISSGWQKLFGEQPTQDQIAMVLAQNALETGNRKSMWNYNVGNITTSGKDYNYFDDLTTSEQVSPGKWEKKNLKYRAYNSLEEGVLDYLKFLSSKRYQNAWQHIINPNPIAFSKELKRSGYYTANEAPYTAGITKLFNQYSKNKYNPAEKPVEDEYSDILAYLAKLEKKSPKVQPVIPVETKVIDPSINNLLEGYLRRIRQAELKDKKLYKKFLPQQNILIQVKANNIIDATEFSRILCMALDEELLSRSCICTDHDHVEIDCCINGPEEECFNTVKQLTNSIADTFKNATFKIGNVNIETNIVMNKRSSYQVMSSKFASINYRKFLLKFVEAK